MSRGDIPTGLLLWLWETSLSNETPQDYEAIRATGAIRRHLYERHLIDELGHLTQKGRMLKALL